MSRGLKNCNPGNIRKSDVVYEGESNGADKSFKTFKSMEYGYRAMFVLLYTYKLSHGHNTLRKMITTYAPASENPTSNYISSVAKAANVNADADLNTKDYTTMVAVVSAMSAFENGVPAVKKDVEAGWKLFKAFLDKQTGK